ncbi:MAG: hypothetical protein AAFR35_16380 [Pseudomonadota bacterium]
MIAETRLPNHKGLILTARFFFTSLFLMSGVTHFKNIPNFVSLLPDAVAPNQPSHGSFARLSQTLSVSVL